MPKRMPRSGRARSSAATSPPKTSIDSTASCVLPWVMMVRLMVLVMALSMTCGTVALRSFLKFSRTRSKTTTDSFT